MQSGEYVENLLRADVVKRQKEDDRDEIHYGNTSWRAEQSRREQATAILSGKPLNTALFGSSNILKDPIMWKVRPVASVNKSFDAD
jgi:hypothetical protein